MSCMLVYFYITDRKLGKLCVSCFHRLLLTLEVLLFKDKALCFQLIISCSVEHSAGQVSALEMDQMEPAELIDCRMCFDFDEARW